MHCYTPLLLVTAAIVISRDLRAPFPLSLTLAPSWQALLGEFLGVAKSAEDQCPSLKLTRQMLAINTGPPLAVSIFHISFLPQTNACLF